MPVGAGLAVGDAGGRRGACGLASVAAGNKLIDHPDVGDLDLSYEAMQLTTDPGLQFVGFTAEPGSASDHTLRLLRSLAARAPEEIRLER